MTDPRKLRPGELCRLLNSTPLGEVITEQQLRRQRMQAGLRIGDTRHVDLIRYVAWLVVLHHAPQPQPATPARDGSDLAEAAQGAAASASRRESKPGNGPQLSRKQEALLAALLTEPTHRAAAAKAGVSEATVYRWLQTPAFRDAYRQARRQLVEMAVGRLQAGTGQAVEALLTVTRAGKRDGDRIRAAIALLDHAFQGLTAADLLHGQPLADDASPMNTSDIVQLLAGRLRQIDAAELPRAEKSRLTATLADALLRAIGVDVLDKRLEALQAVLLDRKDQD